VCCDTVQSLVLLDSVVSYNESGRGGGDWYDYGGGGPGGNGGGVFCSAVATAVIQGCSIEQNHTGLGFHSDAEGGDGGDGGGLYIASPTSLRDCTINRNVCRDGGDSGLPHWGRGGDGGGIAATASVRMSGCVLSQNEAGRAGDYTCFGGPFDPTDAPARSGNGGGIRCSDAVITNCVIACNVTRCGGVNWCLDGSDGAPGLGAGIHCAGGPTLANCLVVANTSLGVGGGVYIADAAPTIANCTLIGNAADDGGGVFCGASSAPSLTNCVAWGNTPQQIHAENVAIVATYCNIEGGTGQPWYGAGCINADPVFVDADGPDNDPATWEDNDYSLNAASPCVDAGTTAGVPVDALDLDGDSCLAEPICLDLGGVARVQDDTDVADSGMPHPPWTALVVDMGAYERGSGSVQPNLCYADMNCDGLVTAADVDGFVIALAGGQTAYEAQFPDCEYLHADCNADLLITAADIDPFVQILVAGG
jgi:hypothetical protein